MPEQTPAIHGVARSLEAPVARRSGGRSLREGKGAHSWGCAVYIPGFGFIPPPPVGAEGLPSEEGGTHLKEEGEIGAFTELIVSRPECEAGAPTGPFRGGSGPYPIFSAQLREES
ncbi:hypothetical protein HMPREF9004_1959 [Schaalia cardiffensis F0333]|uniref:Uncharacterized protein n=1 Tax=Schaalia cardiffensis F0333 TaxID=888050 RepID=N6WAN8_9ACTO|nr:hypothetical protein HMPREF9004_1959 [Schaalia cardiffensis F0333]